MFYTLQGEGIYAGRPAVFVRLAKCNLNCSFCDTFFDDGDWFTYEELSDRIDSAIKQYFNDDVPDWMQFDFETYKARKCVLVLTGGEPMLQKNLQKFIEWSSEEFKYIQIESNGTVFQELPEITTLIVSPKCSEKTGKYLKPNMNVLARADCLKFVMSGDPESPYHTIPDWALAFARDSGRRVYCSPMNIYNTQPKKSKALRSTKNDITLEERSTVDEVISFWEPGLLNMVDNQRNHEYTAQYCAKHGLTFNMQLHLFASLA